MIRTFGIFIAIGLLASAATAQAVWKADRAHSSVAFSVTHMVISEVTGHFSDFEATLNQTAKDDFTGSSVETTIKTASINTDNEGRDKHLRSDDFFNADSFPAITFKSTSFEKTGEGTYKVSGNLTIRDSTKPVVLDAKFNGQLTDKRGTTHAGFKATTSIDRFDFGVKWNRALETGSLVASRKIDITLNLEFVNEKKEDAKPK